DHGRKQLGGQRQVEGVVSTGAPCLVQLAHSAHQCVEGLVIVQFTLDESHTFAELAPYVLPERGPCVLAHCLVSLFGEVLVRPVTAGKTHQTKTRRKHASVGQVVDGR